MWMELDGPIAGHQGCADSDVPATCRPQGSSSKQSKLSRRQNAKGDKSFQVPSIEAAATLRGSAPPLVHCTLWSLAMLYPPCIMCAGAPL